jgi:hypothetical protein
VRHCCCGKFVGNDVCSVVLDDGETLCASCWHVMQLRQISDLPEMNSALVRLFAFTRRNSN